MIKESFHKYDLPESLHPVNLFAKRYSPSRLLERNESESL